MELALIMQIAAYTGNRPSAIINLRHRDIRITLIRLGETSQTKLNIEIAFKGTKKSKKGQNTPCVSLM